VALLKALNLALRFALELASLAALAYWGWHDSESTVVKLLLAIGAPLVWAVLWGVFASPKARVPLHPGARLAFEVAAFGSAVIALASAGRPGLALLLALLCTVNRILIGLWHQDDWHQIA
jgi:Protein of unknown function (DUF2568)